MAALNGGGDQDDGAASACCATSAMACPFGKALLARTAMCELAHRRQRGEQALMECTAAVPRTNCVTLIALAQERARFALKLPPPGRVLTHMQALRVQCGGALALGEVLGMGPGADMHQMVLAAHDSDARFDELPWAELVNRMAAWRPRQRRPGP